MSEFRIEPDRSFEIEFNDGINDRKYVVSGAWDRIDVYIPMGIYILKILDREDGFVQSFLTQDEAEYIGGIAMLPFVEREFLFESEYEGYITSQANQLDYFLDDDDDD